MRLSRKASLAVIMAALILFLPVGPAVAKNYKITVVAGHPPIFLWVTLCRDYFIPEVNKRVEKLGHKIEWNQAYGGTVAKIGGALEAIEEGVISASVAQQTALMPYYAVQIMYNLNNSKVAITSDNASAGVLGIPTVVDTGAIIVDESNYKYFMR